MKFRLEAKRKKLKPPSKLALAFSLWRWQIIVGFVLITVGGLGAVGIWYGTRIASLQITNIVVVGGNTISHKTVEAVARQALVGSYYKLVPYTFKMLYPKKRIVNQLLQISRVKEVRMETNTQTLTIFFTEYQPSALWCASVDSIVCMFIDETGFAFAEAPQLTGSALVRYVQKGKEPSLKTPGFTPLYIETTSRLAERLEADLGLYVTKIVHSDDVDTSYFLAGGAEIKVSERMTAEETFVNLQTIFASEEFAALADGDFHYIDLRFGDKVFVSEVEVVATSTASSSKERVDD
ncbi:MAG: hypothetical protein AUK16_01865 [Parcubacteria group bacterium CG2_30_44_11]|nr:MAG: hypothetical protein AUK16_01865 [Parcubacteria group bacterium CG2_30_44_11]